MPTKPNKDEVLRRSYEGIDTVYHPNIDLYLFTADKLMDGVDSAFNLGFSYNSPDFELYASLSDNVYIFSGAKTFQQTLAMSKEIVKDGKLQTFAEFKKSAGKIFDEYNGNWLEAEYVTAKETASGAKKWNKIQKEIKTFPYLKWVTSSDDTVCPICAPLNGVTLPAKDAFWKRNYTPIHWHCHCYVQQITHEEIIQGDESVSGKREQNRVKKHIEGLGDKVFKNNAGVTGEIFTREHPYFDIPKEYKRLANNNFSLPIPNRHSIKTL